jgi:hypothetical protein
MTLSYVLSSPYHSLNIRLFTHIFTVKPKEAVPLNFIVGPWHMVRCEDLEGIDIRNYPNKDDRLG